MREKVSGVPPGRRRLLIGVFVFLGGALGAALLVIAFLLGRLSATADRAGSGAVPPSTPAAIPQAAAVPVGSATGVDAASAGLPVEPRTPESSGEPDPSATATPTLAPFAGGALDDAGRARVVGYFREVDRLEDMGAGDPQAFARSLMESVTSGDFSGFDALLAKARGQQDRLRSIVPPSACVEHHRRASALARDSVALMERLKAALMKGDAAGLMAMSTEGRDLETRADELRAMAATIRRQAGL